MHGVRISVFGSLSIIDGVVTAHQDPIDIRSMTPQEIREDSHQLAEESRRRRLVRVAEVSKKLRQSRKRLARETQ